MEKRITSVQWSATGLPAGLSFNTATGTFSGTPESAGEYNVPVTVRTNYGENTKNVLISVEEAATAYPVYALGSSAATWSGNAEAYENGFRKLNIPNAYKLQSMYQGFAAKTSSSGDWYLGSSLSDGKVYAATGENFTTPKKYPVEGIAEMISAYDTSNNVYFAYNKKDGSGTYRYKNGSKVSTGTTQMLKLSEDFTADNYAFLHLYNNKLCVSFSSSILSYDGAIEDVKKIGGVAISGRSPDILILKKDGELLTVKSTNTYSFASIFQPFQNENGEVKGVKNFWLSDWWSTLFVLFSDNALYARGSNYNCDTGLSADTTVSPSYLLKVGNFNVKKICQPFLLTEDGKLYHTGNLSSSHRMYVEGIGSHSEFTQIFPEYTFDDIAFPYGAHTLVVTIKD